MPASYSDCSTGIFVQRFGCLSVLIHTHRPLILFNGCIFSIVWAFFFKLNSQMAFVWPVVYDALFNLVYGSFTLLCNCQIQLTLEQCGGPGADPHSQNPHVTLDSPETKLLVACCWPEASPTSTVHYTYVVCTMYYVLTIK